MQLTSIWCYPVKSCQGIAQPTARLDPFGLEGDRLFAITEVDGKAMSQRTMPRLNLVSVTLSATHLRLTAPGQPDLLVDLREAGTPVAVDLYGPATGESMGLQASAWLTEFLGRPCRLVRSHEEYRRDMPPIAAHLFLPVQRRYPDCAPLLLVGEASLADLNRRAEAPVAMSQFRPNLIVAGAPAYAEDGWRTIRVGEMLLDYMGLTERCGVTLVVPGTEKRGREPLLTLQSYRVMAERLSTGIAFGAYFKPRRPGVLREGDDVEVIEQGEPPAFVAA